VPGPEHESGLEISLDEINRLEYVDDRSELIPDDFIQIAGENSLAWAKSLDMGPFDVINIDLCDSIAKARISEFEANHYNALNKLMVLQSYRKQPWLLLLTTRTNESAVNPEVFDTLKKVYLDNLNKCKGFADKSNEIISVANEFALNDYCTREDGFSNVFLIGLSKWILSIGIGQIPQSGVEIKNIMGYKVSPDADSPDLISIALQINPTMNVPVDKVGLAHKTSALVDECSKAIEMLDRLSSQQDVDAILNSDSSINDLMIKHTSDLLEQARYDISNYETWAKRKSTLVTGKAQKYRNNHNIVDTFSNIKPKTKNNDVKKIDAPVSVSGKIQLTGPKIIGKIDLKDFEKYKKK
jgi:hypothetical protein